MLFIFNPFNSKVHEKRKYSTELHLSLFPLDRYRYVSGVQNIYLRIELVMCIWVPLGILHICVYNQKAKISLGFHRSKLKD